MLFLGAGGYVTCSWVTCPEPDAPSRLFDRGDRADVLATLHARIEALPADQESDWFGPLDEYLLRAKVLAVIDQHTQEGAEDE